MVCPGEGGGVTVFAELLHEVKNASESSVSAGRANVEPVACRLAARRVGVLSDIQQLYLDVLLYMVYCRGMRADVLLTGKIAEQSADVPEQAAALVDAHRTARQRALFPLPKDITPASLLKKIEAVAGVVLNDARCTIDDTTATALWIEAALDCGVSCEDVCACVAQLPAAYEWMKFLKATRLGVDDIRDITVRVADHINPTRAYWYAMKLRSGVTPDDVKAAIVKSVAESPVEEYFYPCVEISKRVGKRLVHNGVPLIADILFFKIHADDIAPLFSNIGNLAWCYRENVNSKYAVIPDGEMLRFQRNIGIFTPDFELTAIGEHPITEGQRVRIVSGAMTGYEGTVYRLLPADAESPADAEPSTGGVSSVCASSKYVFRLNVLGDQGIEWLVDLAPCQIELT
jgi:hypothetical protein